MAMEPPSPPPPRVLKFIKLLARHLSEDDTWASSSPAISDSATLEELLKKSVSDLPSGKLRSILEQDLPRFVTALQDELRVTRQNAESASEESLLSSSLSRLLEGSLFADQDYASLVETLVDAVARGAGSGTQGFTWCSGARRLLLARKEPPLQLVWAYCTLGIQTHLRNENATLPSLAKALLHLVKTAVIGNSTTSTSVAAMAPVVALLFKSTKKTARALKEGVEGSKGVCMEDVVCKDSGNLKILQDMTRELLNFIIVCRNKMKSCEDCPLGGLPLSPISCQSFPSAFRCFSLLVEALGINISSEVEMVRAMFPLTSKATVKALRKYQVNVDDISVMVVSQVILLRLILECIDKRNILKTKGTTSEIFSQNAMAKMREIAVHSIAATGGHDCFGSDMMLDVLQSPRLPVGDLLNKEEENILRSILYEAVLIEQPSFGQIDIFPSALHPGKGSVTFLQKVAVARKAIRHFRLHCERTRAITLLEAIKSYSVPPDFLQWFSKIKIKREKPEANLQNVQELIEWLIDIDDTLFNTFYSKLTIGDGSKFRTEKQDVMVDGEEMIPVNGAKKVSTATDSVSLSVPDDEFFFVDTKGEEGEDEKFKAADKSFIIAAAKMQVSARTVREKPKHVTLFQRHNQVKVLKRSRKSIAESESDSDLGDASDKSQEAKKKGKLSVAERHSDLNSDGEKPHENSKENGVIGYDISRGKRNGFGHRDNSEAQSLETMTKDSDTSEDA